jgi:hypothetical protein
MKYINLYLQEIERRLPTLNRADILKEIRSTLLDMIEDRKPDPNQAADEDTIKAVLSEFGSPRKVAQRYSKHNYLIGPSLFPIYLQVLKVVLIVVAALNLLGLIVAIVNQSGIGPNMIEAIANIIAGLFSSLFTAFGIVTLSFAGIERTTPDTWKVKIEQDWKPEDLLKTEDRKSVKVTEIAFEITFTMVFIVLINFFLDKIGIYYLADSGWVSTPILNENFLRYVPWLTAANILSIVLNLYLLRKGYWDYIATIAKILINVFNIAISFSILTGPEVITIASTAMEALNINLPYTVQEVSKFLNTGLDILMGLSIFGLVVESIKRIYETFIKGSHTRFEIETD